MKPATEKQITYIRGLLETAMLDGKQRDDISRRFREGLTHADCVEIIPILQTQQAPRQVRRAGLRRGSDDDWDYDDGYGGGYRDSFDGIAGHPDNHGSH